jgi:hypothetical protein
VDDDGVGQNLARARLGPFHHVDRLLDGVGRQHLSVVEQADQFLEQFRDALGFDAVARDGDLVSANEDRRRERVLDDLQ